MAAVTPTTSVSSAWLGIVLPAAVSSARAAAANLFIIPPPVRLFESARCCDHSSPALNSDQGALRGAPLLTPHVARPFCGCASGMRSRPQLRQCALVFADEQVVP